jgi:hypothetical protein
MQPKQALVVVELLLFHTHMKNKHKIKKLLKKPQEKRKQ